MKMIKVKYEVLPAVLDPEEALDGPILVHPEDSWKALCPVGADNKRSLCAQAEDGHGDVEKVLAECDVVVEHTYHVKAARQAMMEPFQTVCFMDMYGRLNVMSSHADRLPCAPYCFQCAWRTKEIQDPCV